MRVDDGRASYTAVRHARSCLSCWLRNGSHQRSRPLGSGQTVGPFTSGCTRYRTLQNRTGNNLHDPVLRAALRLALRGGLDQAMSGCGPFRPWESRATTSEIGESGHEADIARRPSLTLSGIVSRHLMHRTHAVPRRRSYCRRREIFSEQPATHSRSSNALRTPRCKRASDAGSRVD